MIDSIKLGYKFDKSIDDADSKMGYIVGKSARVVTSTASLLVNLISQLFVIIICTLFILPIKIEAKYKNKPFYQTSSGKLSNDIATPLIEFTENARKHAHPVFKIENSVLTYLYTKHVFLKAIA